MKARVAAVALLVLCGLAGCGSKAGDSGTDGTGILGEAASPSATATATGAPTGTPPPTDTTGHSAGNPLACRLLPDALVGNTTFPLADYQPGTVKLSAGKYTGGDGSVVELQTPCGIGDLNMDGVFDAMGVVKISAGGTGRFYTLVVWLSNNSGVPQLAASKGLGDRNPVESIAIASNQAKVVYLTRTPDVPMAGLNIRRTATYRLTDTGLAELSHIDTPYTP